MTADKGARLLWGRVGGGTCTKATITSWPVPRAQRLKCVCKMMWERPFAKQREGRWRGKNDCFRTIEHVHPEAGAGVGVEVADWGLTRPPAVPQELDSAGVWFLWWPFWREEGQGLSPRERIAKGVGLSDCIGVKCPCQVHNFMFQRCRKTCLWLMC